MQHRPRWVGALFPLVCLALAGCSAPSVSGSFAGAVPETDAFIAIVTDGTDVRAYLCDGRDDGVTMSEWFRGTVIAGTLDLTSTSGNARLTGGVGDGAVSGDLLLPDGRSVTLTVPRVTGDAGLHGFKQSTGEVSVQAGWVIIIPEGVEQQRGAVAFGATGALQANTRLDTGSNTAEIQGLGTITTGQVTPSNVRRFFTNGWP
jgi:hypothetical protein